MKLSFYGLLHIQDGEKSAMNFNPSDFDEQIIIYVGNAITLAKSLSNQEIDFTLLTNDTKKVKAISKQVFHYSLKTKEIPFNSKIPRGSEFYSAQFKLDVYRFFSEEQDDYMIFCDLDVVCVGLIPDSFKNIIVLKLPLYYDVTAQMLPVCKHEGLIKDLELMHGNKSEGRWSGGEFISGSPAFFKKLVNKIDCIFDNYIDNINHLNHVSDESFTSAALELMRFENIYIAEAGSLGILERYWNAEIKHIQKPFNHYKNLFLLHLPADKDFLRKMAFGKFDTQIFLSKYEKEIQSRKQKSIISKIKSKLNPKF